VKFIRDSLLVILGNVILAFGFAVFAVPANLIVGGATGIGLIIERLTQINYATVVFIINMAMLVVGYFGLGKKFAAGTILSSFIFPFFLSLFESLPQLQNLTNDILLSAVYAGVFTGAGLGIVFRLGYSTGGMDVPPLLINKKFGVPLAAAINIEDSLILIGQVFFSSFEGILYGLITVFASTFVMNRVMVMGEKNLQVFIISSKHQEISEAIFKEIDRGCTFVNVTTGYFQQPQKAVLCVASTRQSAKMHDVVLKIDPTAFIISSEIHSVKGRGFTLPNIDLEKQ